jgi:hypothetical protein
VKKLLLTIVVASFASYSYAQNITGGVKAGLNLADQKYSIDGTTAGHQLKAGFHGGVYMIAMINDKFGIQPELLYSMQGSKLEFPLFGYDYVTSFNYLSIPVLARYNFTDRFSAQVGPQFGFLMSAEVEANDGNQTTITDVKDEYKAMDVSGVLGLEFEIVAGLGAGTRYIFGLTKINDDDSDGKVKNSNIQIYLKYKLFGGKK